LHHLPDEALLQACFGEIARIVKDPGAVYLADFGRLKREATLEFLASRDAGRHPPRYVADFRDSLRAAFPLPALRTAARRLAFLEGLSVRHTFLVPFLVVVATPPRHPLPGAAVAACRDLWLRLPADQRRDFEDLRAFLGAGGLPTPHPAG
jgi:SAM-dependent methyltransferase